MKSLKSVIFPLVFVLGLCIMLTPEKGVYAEETTENPTIKYFDENNKQIFPYSQKELNQLPKQQKHINLLSNWKIYSFGETSFNYNIWIGNGRSFYNPGTILLETSD